MHSDLLRENSRLPSLPSARVHHKRTRADKALRRWLQSVNRWWKRRRMIAAFEAMDDPLLQDIGIFRGDIPRVVDGFSDRELRMVPLAPAAKPVEIQDDMNRVAA